MKPAARESDACVGPASAVGLTVSVTMLVDVTVVVAGHSSSPVSSGPFEGSGDGDDAAVGAASTSEEVRILTGTPVLKEIPVPVPVAP